jgi:putative ABC transport system permease protein
MKAWAETHGVKFELVRHFVARMLDGEWSSTPGQWRNVAIGAFAMLVPAGLLILREGSTNAIDSSKYRRLAELADKAPLHAAMTADTLSLITVVLAVTGLLGLIQWQSLFPGRRDYLSLAGLPIRSRQIFLARFAAVMLFSAGLVTVMNILPAVLAPLEFGGQWQPDSTYWPKAGAMALATGLGCFFLLFSMVALQGVLWSLLPARWFTRVSVYLQGLLVGVLFFIALYAWNIRDWTMRDVAHLPEFAWAPPVWFLGLHERVLGDQGAFYAVMADRAWMALAVAAALMVLSYLLSYQRYRQLLIEAPVHIEAPRSGKWSLLRLLARNPQQEAILAFLSKTLARSRANRTIWLAYIGAAVALMVNSSLIDGSHLTGRGVGLGKGIKFAILYWPLGLSVVLLAGIRHVFRLPAELPANWIFRLTETQGRKQWMQAVERFTLCYAVLPIYALVFPVAVRAVGWSMALRVAALQVLVSLTLFDCLFYGWQQLPFTCSYVPGKRPMVQIVAMYIITLCALVPILAVLLAAAADFVPLFPFVLALFGGIWIWVRRSRKDGWGEARLLYQELPDALPDLGIAEMVWNRPPEATFAPHIVRPAIELAGFGAAPPAPPPVGRAGWFAGLWQDVRFAVRQLRRSPGFTAMACLTMGLGIGATTAIYSMIDTVLWRPLPLPQLSKLAMLVQTVPGQPHLWTPASPADIESIRRQDTLLESLATWQTTAVNVVDSGGEGLRLDATRVSPNFLSVAGVRPAIGRSFLGHSDQPGLDREAILSDTLWRTHFGGDPNIVGKTIRVDGRDYSVVGIMPAGFYFPQPLGQLWIPLAMTAEERNSRDLLMLESGGRLSPGHTLAQLDAELGGISARLRREYPDTDSHRAFRAWSAQRFFTGDLAAVYAALVLGAALFVLLIACVNVANMQLARAAGRWKEIAMRIALGARRGRLMRQLVTESIALSLFAAGLGLLFAKWGLAVLAAHIPAEMVRFRPGLADIGLNWHALLFTLAAAVGSGILAGLMPAWRGSRASLVTGPEGPGRHRLRSLLVAAQVALAVVLLTGAGLMVRGFQMLTASNPALDPSHVLTLQIALTTNRDPAPYYRQVLDAVASLPGVRSVAAVTALPYSRHGGASPVTLDDQPTGLGRHPSAWIQRATPEVFASLHIPLRAGRLLSANDSATAPRVAVVSESAARRWWPDGTAVGRRVRIGGAWMEVVGVSGDIEHSVIDRHPVPTVYLAFVQSPERQMDLAIRTAGDAVLFAPAIRAAIRAVDPEQPVANLNSLTNLIQQEAFVVVYMAALMGVFGVLALVLSSAGVYGVMAYVVAGQTQEIGIRMALGAPRAAVFWRLFQRGMRTAIAGLITGLIPAYALARLLRSVVFGVSAVSPAAFLGVPLLLVLAAAVAIYIPAWRALKVDPMAALRVE